jgi:predicted short-subunit dehydrogenase-like oxidoreductase (DUF2520 family)
MNSDLNSGSIDLKNYQDIADRTLLLITDSAINLFLEQNSFLRTKKTIHFSGATQVPGIENVHPLMSFSQNLFSKEFYPSIPFSVFLDNEFDNENDTPSSWKTEKKLEDILPGLRNPFFYIRQKDKALYHAFCVMIGNFSTLLWQIGISKSTEYLNIPSTNHSLNKNYFKPYLEKILENFYSQTGSALTGPLARGDISTIKSNIEALPEQNLKDLYMQFVKLYLPQENL